MRCFPRAFWLPEVLSWEEKAVDKDGGQMVDVEAHCLEEEKIQYWFPSHQQGLLPKPALSGE